ncbi:hypothetical protein KC19_2G152900, partial [Ceratodon purpureus]
WEARALSGYGSKKVYTTSSVGLQGRRVRSSHTSTRIAQLENIRRFCFRIAAWVATDCSRHTSNRCSSRASSPGPRL